MQSEKEKYGESVQFFSGDNLMVNIDDKWRLDASSNTPVIVNLYPGRVVWYEPFPGAERERGVISSLCSDPDYVFVRYTEGITAARTAVSDLFLHQK